MAKIPQTEQELKKELQEQLESLKVLCEQYDSGKIFFAKQIAVVLRLLLHQGSRKSNSKALLSQLAMLDTQPFFSTIPQSPVNGLQTGKRIGSYMGLVAFHSTWDGTGSDCLPYLDEAPSKRYILFDDYWKEIVLVDKDGNSFTRENLVKAVADQGGGAHVDSALEENYSNLVKKNSLGWVKTDGVREVPLEGVHFSTIRQIAHEVLRTLIPEYPIQKFTKRKTDFIISDISFYEAQGTIFHQEKVGRNDPCPCGVINPATGKVYKWKKCHGK